MLRIYRQITGIKCDVPMQVTEAELALTPADKETVDAFCDEMKFGVRVRERIA